MRKCHETIEFLRAYLDGDLPEEERKTFEGHLERCPPCVDYIESYRTTIALAREACACEDTPPPPEALVRAILEARKRDR